MSKPFDEGACLPTSGMTPLRTTKASSPAAALPLLLIVLIDSMGFAMLTPLLAAELAPDSTAAIGGLSEDARYIIYGVATGLYPMMMFFGAPIPASFPTCGRKRMLLICCRNRVELHDTPVAPLRSVRSFS